jgi:aminotransferase
VIVFEPFYGYHLSTLHAVRAVPVVVGLSAPDWELDLAAVREAVTPRTKAMLVNTPSNPAGKVFTREELEGLGEIAEEFGFFVLTDEIYEHFLYGGAKHVSPASLPGMRERTILMSGFSKTFSVTGWRVGYLIADAKWLGSIGYFHDLTYVCAPSPFQHGVADGVEQLPLSFYEGLATEHLGKRAMLLEALTDAGLTPHVPEGAYYILADASGVEGETAAKKARTLLRETGVGSVAGSAFFRPGGGENLLRFCFAKKDTDLADACRRLRARGRA